MRFAAIQNRNCIALCLIFLWLESQLFGSVIATCRSIGTFLAGILVRTALCAAGSGFLALFARPEV